MAQAMGNRRRHSLRHTLHGHSRRDESGVIIVKWSMRVEDAVPAVAAPRLNAHRRNSHDLRRGLLAVAAPRLKKVPLPIFVRFEYAGRRA